MKPPPLFDTRAIPAHHEAFLTQKSVARRLRVSEVKLSRLLSAGKIKAVGRTNSGALLFKSADLDLQLAGERDELAAKILRMDPDQRLQLIRDIAEDNARLNHRAEPGDLEFKMAREHIAASLLQAEARGHIQQVTRSAQQLSATMRRMTGEVTPEIRQRLRLRAERVDTLSGVIRRCIVAKAGVQALGKTVMLNRAGAVVTDPAQCVKKLPVWTDEKTLDTLIAAAGTEKIKAREDHNDSIGARAGFLDTFVRDGDCVRADLQLLDSYQNRPLVLEIASTAPEQLGLSMDFIPEFEILSDRALMRVKELLAVDIVDEGAITPTGLL